MRHEVRDRTGRLLADELIEAQVPLCWGPVLDLGELQPGDWLTVRRTGGLGDCIMVLPALRALRDEHPEVRVCFETSPEYEALLNRFAEVDTVQAGRPGAVRRPGPFADLNWYAERHPDAWCRDRVELFAEALGARLAGRPPEYVPRPEDIHQATDWLRARQCLDVPKVALALRASSWHRSWPEGHVWELAGILSSSGVGVVVLDSDPDAPMPPAEYRLVQAAYGLPLPVVAGILTQCEAVVTPDTGILYLGATLGLPAVGLFGPVDPRIRTRSYPLIVALTAREVQCIPCCESVAQAGCLRLCMEALTPENVRDALGGLAPRLVPTGRRRSHG